MKKKEKTTLGEASVDQLKKRAVELEKDLETLAINRYTKQSKNVRESKILRYKLAVVKTIIRQKEMINENR